MEVQRTGNISLARMRYIGIDAGHQRCIANAFLKKKQLATEAGRFLCFCGNF
ncbi:hypothetical protein SAMN04487894_10350 [Niabella drilacis]|uniref:Uncharacterized protein n=1 Tax=Niabella drilacis (strain DSM 25811 / CCM 8410 / CCUG 62505 / LMG 26954 / E90) TaxID=1285928 RepID=A0A1G6MWJ7_NIADE|nr:hypothetical protein SAMN04487894_10350 [Niabella drilacis]